ncbi:MAG: V-type ATP synthase subunit E family protein [Methanoregula sp.]|nr:V-type ATP synthase subunit E family protein [Methanoregula sp.]
MAYENLLKSVDESAEERERELRETARITIESLIKKAREQAEQIRQSHISDAEKSAAIEKNKLMYLAGAENKAHLIKIREHLFAAAFDEAKLRLSQLRNDPEYPDIFKKLTVDAAASFQEGGFHVHVDKRDEELCRKTLASLNLHAEIIPDLKSAGGLVACLPNQSVIISNTVESRLERAQDLKKLEIYSILTGD